MSRKKPYTVLCLGTVLVLFALAASAQELPKAGDKLGKISFTAPVSAEDLAYLGVGKGAKEFTLDQIKAPLVVLQLFSMYCTYCQEEAPQVNEFYKLINQKGLGDKIKIFGVGIKNSRMEADLFRKKFKVAFPLLPDPEGIVHGQLGSPMTPFFVVIDNKDGGGIIFTHLGAMPSAESFLQSVVSKAGLK